MSDRLQQLEIFVRAAERGSFSRAAAELGLSQPSVSRAVANLEERLGVALMVRNTRRSSLTEAGVILLERARQLLADATEAEEAARGAGELSGLLRVATTHAFGTREFVPLLPEFLSAHPAVRIDLVMSDKTKDLIANRVDVAFRVGRLANSSLRARHLAVAPRYAVASPEYLQRHGAPKVPGDVVKHDCISGPGATGPENWCFQRKGKAVSVPVSGRVTVASAPALVACATQGLGITILATLMCRSELSAGALVRVLHEYLLEPLGLHAVFPAGRRPSTKARALAEHVAARLPSFS